MSSAPDSNTVWEALKNVPDPEFGIDIVNMGLVYDVDAKDGDINVRMTLTTPSCPSGGWIYEGAKEALAGLPGARNVKVDMVFEPPWNPEMLSETAQRQLGRIP